jgi:hypothetical protein
MLLILLSLPFLAVSFLADFARAAAAVPFPCFHRRPSDAANLANLQPVDEFGFENALQAYAELIGAYSWRAP